MTRATAGVPCQALSGRQTKTLVLPAARSALLSDEPETSAADTRFGSQEVNRTGYPNGS